MTQDLKNIHIGNRIRQEVENQDISIERICNFMNMPQNDIVNQYDQKSIDTDLLLKWSKLLKYDFFRLYVNHLMLFDSIVHTKTNKAIRENGGKIEFRKNIYTKEIKDFLIELITTEQKTIQQIIEEYSIPKTTLYKWRRKREE